MAELTASPIEVPAHIQNERTIANREFGPKTSSHMTVDLVTQQGQLEAKSFPAIDHAALGRKVDKDHQRSLASVMQRVKALGTVPGVVVSFLPIELRSDSYLYPLKVAVIKPPQGNDPYAIYIFREYFFDYTKQHVDSPTTAFEWPPITMALDFEGTNPQGVFTFSFGPQYKGRTPQEVIEDPAWLAMESPEPQHNGRTYGEALEAKRQSALAWMYEKLRIGNETDQIKQRVDLPSKAAARRLHALGMIQVLPAWVEKQRDLGVKPQTCQQCGKRCEPGAVTCTNMGCGGSFGPYVIDPRKAFEIGAITEEHPALERLSRAELKEMGISDYVAESLEEKAARLRQGGIKPRSLSAMRLLEAEDQYKAIDATRTGTAIATAVAEAVSGGKKGNEKLPEEK